MINKTRKKFIYVTMSLLALVLILVSSAIMITIKINNNIKTHENLQRLIGDDLQQKPNDKPPHMEEQFFGFKSFTVTLDVDGQIIQLNYDKNAFLESEIISAAQEIVSSNKASGSISNLAFITKTTASGIKIAATDQSIENTSYLQTLLIVLSCLAIGIVLLFIIVWRLSFWIIKPVQNAMTRQKQFISDAGHELKTPLTIISANTDIMQSELGENKWLTSTTLQTERMNTLIQDMLSLAKLDEKNTLQVGSTFELSKLAQNCALSFDALAFENNKRIDTDIPANIFAFSIADDIKRILTILLDNAIKHSADGGQIDLKLTCQNNTAEISVKSVGCNLTDAECDRLFERFYRGDPARCRDNGGSGLGLAIAASLAEKNSLSLTLEHRQNSYMKFVLSGIPRKN